MSATAEFPEIAGRPFRLEASVDVEAGEVEQLPAVVERAGDLVEWTPDRAASVVRGFGMVLHTLDPVTELDGGADLWRATATEAQEIGEPLSRILARYEPARRLAGVVDEAELGAAFVGYAKRNLKMRGRVVLAAREERGEAFGDGSAD